MNTNPITHDRLPAVNRLLAVTVFTSLAFFHPAYILGVVYFFALLYMFLSGQKQRFWQLLVASGMTIIWLLIAKEQYLYSENSVSLFGFNLFPLFAFPLGMIALLSIHEWVRERLHIQRTLLEFVVFVCVNSILLIFVEYVGYTFFGIQNSATAMYEGIPWCDCLHAPWWMQLTYFAFGPIFFVLTRVLQLQK